MDSDKKNKVIYQDNENEIRNCNAIATCTIILIIILLIILICIVCNLFIRRGDTYENESERIESKASESIIYSNIEV